MHYRMTPLASLLSLALVAAAATAAEAPTTPTRPGQDVPAKPAAPAASGPAAAATPPAAADEPKAYDKVITADAKSQQGLFKIHSVKNKLYFEIPKALLEQQLLMVATATAVPTGADHVGRAINEDVVRFILKGNRVLFQTVSHAYVSDPNRPIAPAVQGSQRDTILASYPVEAFSKDGSPVIEVSKLFTSEVGDFSARQVVRGTALDSGRSFVDSSKAFAGSLRVDAVHTYSLAPSISLPAIPGMPPMPQPPARSGSVNVAYNIVKLPEKPMMPRLMDDRVGFFSISRVDYGSDEHESKRERLITRWRLEKKDPNAAVSEPVKPVVWYIDSATPANLVPYVKKGVEEWNVAFEAAGFKNAIQARTFPTKEEDPEFDPQDVRYSIIRWVPSPVANAYGPHLSDPRTGEILNANIVMYHNIMQLQRDWYVTQAGAVDPRAQKLPLPDDLMGDLVAYVVTHEVGHSLGFPHNMKSSSLYPTEKLRDPKWLKEMSHVATLMDYSRFNYVAQPEDKIDPALLIPKIGPYDIFATKWGYMPVPSAKTPEAEQPVLNALVREQDTKPWLRFSTPKGEGDFGENTEAVGDADAVMATTLGTKNLKRIVKMLPGMTLKAGREDKALEELYRASWGQWNRELGHVVAVVGSYSTQNKHGDQPGAIFTATTKDKQVRAVKFLSEQLLATPSWILDPAITERLRPSEPGNMLLASQRNVLRGLLDRSRMARLQNQEAAGGDKAYRTDELLADLRAGVFSELNGGAKIQPARRNLQRVYLELLGERVNQAGSAAGDDSKALVRAELSELRGLLAAKAAAAGDRVQRAHLAAMADYAGKVLDPKMADNSSSGVVLRIGITDEHACWPHAH